MSFVACKSSKEASPFQIVFCKRKKLVTVSVVVAIYGYVDSFSYALDSCWCGFQFKRDFQETLKE